MSLKTSLICIFALALFSACNNSKKMAETPKSAPAFVTWDKKLLDLGKVKKGEKREMAFEFTNTSGKDVQVETIDACDCTTVEFPRGIIQPGKKGHFDVTFDSKDKDAGETIPVNIFFKQTDANGNPIIERIEYKFELEK